MSDQKTPDENQTPEDSQTPENQSSEPKKVVSAPIVAVNEKGLFAFENHIQLAAAASMMIQTMMAPKHLIKEGKEAVMAALLLCRQFNLPQKSMSQMCFINGRLTCYGSLVMALAERHPQFGSKREFFVNQDFKEISVKNQNLKDVPWAAVIRIKKKDADFWNEYFFSVDDAELAGLVHEKLRTDAPWLKYVKDMLKHKTRKRALDAEYASALEGIEYEEDIREIIDVTPKRGMENDPASQINGLMTQEDS